MVNLQNIKVKADSSFQTVCPFPVGFVYSSMNSTSPASIFGGSWTEIKGRFPYFNAGTGTGGSNEVTLTVAQLPPHLHHLQDGPQGHEAGWNAGAGGGDKLLYSSMPGARNLFEFYNERTTATGSGESHNNMPAYQTLYAWYRTA